MKKKSSLVEALAVAPGVTAVIGGGGKTSLLRVLGSELHARGSRVVLCTTTRIRAFSDLPGGALKDARSAQQLLDEAGLIWAGSPAGPGKWGPPDIPIEELSAMAEYVLVEADGSAGLPMKAHRPFEPVVPENANQTVLVIGAAGFGQTIRNAAHCPQLYADLAGCTADDVLTPTVAARVLASEHLQDRIFINQVDSSEHLEAARELAQICCCPGCAGRLKDATGEQMEEICLLW